MFSFPQITSPTYDPKLGFCENNKIPLTFLAIGGALTTLGIALLCASANTGVTALAGIVTTLGVPMLSYGIFMLIYNRCTYGGGCCCESKKNNENKPIEVQKRTGPATDSEKTRREKRAEAAEKRAQEDADRKKAEEAKA